jgi:hypothetical protein
LWAAGRYVDLSNIVHTEALHYDGSAWTVVPSLDPGSAGNAFNSSWASSSNSIWFLGSQATAKGNPPLAEYWDGMNFTNQPVPAVGTGFNVFVGAGGLPGSYPWAVGYYDDNAGVSHTLIERYKWGGPPTPTATATPVACQITFTDVHPNDFFYPGVQYLYCRNVISGYTTSPPCLPSGSPCFKPYNNTTRAQMVKIVVLGFAKTIHTPPSGGHTFTDVLPGSTFFSYVETGAYNNVVSGYACGGPGEPCDPQHRPYFRPGNQVTRGQLSKIDAVAARWTLINPTTGSFEDVLPNTAFYQYVETAYCHGVISGYTCGGPGEPCDQEHRPYFRQQNDATRGQISKIVYQSIINPPGSCNPAVTPTATATAILTATPTTGIK